GEPDLEACFDLLADDTPAPDEELPATGLAPEWERALSCIFIRAPGYGTRVSTVILVRSDGRTTVAERTYSPGGGPTATWTFELDWAPAWTGGGG
ncbi:MAG: hypothetical protein D6746_03455, partial [Bacteroidetes bacterium]